MAEFQEVMEQWRRFCESHSNCCECEFDRKGICDKAHLSDVPYSDIELRIMAWAAEHPKPVYPTWAEWLVDSGVFPQKMSTIPSVAFNTIRDSLSVRIPADIARKLGIEPKEA